jgi:hypothetical protein
VWYALLNESVTEVEESNPGDRGTPGRQLELTLFSKEA